MRLTNILSIAAILFAAVACSSDSDILNEISTGNGTTSKAGEAVIAFSVQADKAVTKAGESHEEENTVASTISNYTLFLFDNNGNVYSAYYGANLSELDNYFVQVKFDGETKTFQTLLIANGGDLTSSKTLSEVQNISLDAATYPMISNLATVKVNTGWESIAEAKNYVNVANMTLSHLTAQININNLNLFFKEGTLPTDVTMTDFALTIKDDSKDYGYGDVTSLGTSGINFDINETTFAPATAFVSFELNYNGRNLRVNFEINRATGNGFTNNTHEGIKAGNIYNVDINVTLTGADPVVELILYTQDWVLGEEMTSTIEIDLSVFDK